MNHLKRKQKVIAYLVLIPLLWACDKDCKLSDEPAQCHIYDSCELVEEENLQLSTILENYIHEISGSEPNLDMEELAAMDDELASAEWIGLGEATHGSKEFFEMKDRIFRYLVAKHGFKVMGFEATWGGALHVNQYVLHGIGSAQESIKKMKFWTWSTEEVVNLVEWMRAYNIDRAAADKLHFYGFDMQYADEEYYWLNTYLERVLPELKVEVMPNIKGFVDVASNNYENIPAQGRLEYREAIMEAQTAFEARKEELIELSSEQEYELMRYTFVVLLQTEDILERSSGFSRDYYMAENSTWIQNYMGAGTKTALWAHNGHVQKESSYAQGYFLNQTHGDLYKAIGFSFSNGSFQAVQEGRGLTTDNKVESTGCKTVNNLLNSMSAADYYIVFDELEPDEILMPYFSRSKPVFMLGAYFDPANPGRFVRNTTLSSAYDILIHFTTSTAAKPF